MSGRQLILNLALCAAALFAADTAVAAPSSIGAFGGWSAFVDRSSGKKVCYVGAKPKKSEGKYAKRDEIYLLVTHRPAEKVVAEVSFEAGYAFKPGAEPVASVDKKSFRLLAKGTNAWAKDAAMDRSLVAAMRAGDELVVKGVSTRGTATTDTYSLAGFSAALDAISKACGAS